LPKRGRFGTKKLQKREKIAKNARKLMQKIAKTTRKRRQIVENGVDQIDLGGVGENPETKKRKNNFFARRFRQFVAVFLV
jgi:hypothetical protein